MVESTVSPAPSKYDCSIDQLDASSHYGRLALKIGQGKRVLELGCSSGYLSAALERQFGCTVVGIEVDAEAAAAAASACSKVIVADLDQCDLTELLEGQSFDVVLCADVLEHLRDPSSVLRQVRSLLSENGYLVASIPHIGHGSVRLALLSGQFPYRALGLLDDTHLRFFNRRSVEELFEGAGYAVTAVDRNLWHVFDSEVGSRLGSYPQSVVSALYSDAEIETYQFIVEARPYRREEAVGDWQQHRSAGAASEQLPLVEFILFETPDQPIDDQVLGYLKQINYPSKSLRFHLVRVADKRVDTASKITVEKFEFADHDFRRFRFVSSCEMDNNGDFRPASRKLSSINKGAVLKWLLPRLNNDLYFVADTNTLPAAGCLRELVSYAETHRDAPLVAATPELLRRPAASPNQDGTVSWTSLSCVLLRPGAVPEGIEPERDLDSPAQDVDYSWQLWLSGKPPVRVPGARCFTSGISDWEASEWRPNVLYDAARMRAVWGTPRQLVSFIRYAGRRLFEASPWPAFVFLVMSALSIPIWLTQRQKLWQGAASGKPPGVDFHGTGYSIYGPPSG